VLLSSRSRNHTDKKRTGNESSVPAQSCSKTGKCGRVGKKTSKGTKELIGNAAGGGEDIRRIRAKKTTTVRPKTQEKSHSLQKQHEFKNNSSWGRQRKKTRGATSNRVTSIHTDKRRERGNQGGWGGENKLAEGGMSKNWQISDLTGL